MKLTTKEMDLIRRALAALAMDKTQKARTVTACKKLAQKIVLASVTGD